MNLFREQDRVFDYAYGWGTVFRVSTYKFIDYKVWVKFEKGENHYTLDGRASMAGPKVLSFKEYSLSEKIDQESGIKRYLIEETTKIIEEKLSKMRNIIKSADVKVSLELELQ